jgi:hypothetical protein
MATTVATLQARAIAECGARTDISAGDQLAAYNNGQQLICRLANLRDMRTSDSTTMDTVDGAFSINLPANVKSIINLRVIDGTESWIIRRLTCTQFDRMFPLPTATSYEAHPEWYCRRSATTVNIFPVADAAYNLTIDYYKWMAFHAANTENINFATMEDALVEAMKVYVYTRLALWENVAGTKASLIGMIQSALAAENENLDTTHRVGIYSGASVPLVPDAYLDPRTDSI